MSKKNENDENCYALGDIPPKKDIERTLSDQCGTSTAIASDVATNFLKNTNDFTDLSSMQRIVKTTTTKVKKCGVVDTNEHSF